MQAVAYMFFGLVLMMKMNTIDGSDLQECLTGCTSAASTCITGCSNNLECKVDCYETQGQCICDCEADHQQ